MPGESTIANAELDSYLASFVSAGKLDRFDAALQNRTRHITVALEDVYQRQNASAVLRSCDCFGIQDVHVIENELPFRINPDVARGAAQWLSVRSHSSEDNPRIIGANTSDCIRALRDQGYRIIATAPSSSGIPLEEYDITAKTAIFFGTEKRGLSPIARDQADGFLTIPMHGLTRSFNLSVAVALCLYELTRKLRESNIPWQLSDDERAALRSEWVRLVLKKRLRDHETTFLRLIAERMPARQDLRAAIDTPGD
ncbi:MAG: TrmH family RNA methyltransferase [Planctomycetaceae bacterium]